MDNFNKTDDLYDPHFSIDSSNTEKLDMYGVWLKKKKDTADSTDPDNAQTIQGDDDFSFSDTFSELDNGDGASEFDEIKNENSETVPLETGTSDTDNADIALGEDTFESLDLDDFLNDEAPEAAQKEEAESVIEEDPIDLDFTEITDEAAKPVNDDTAPAGLENFNEISLEDFEDAAPEDIGKQESFDDFDDILNESEAEEQTANAAQQRKEEALDIHVTVDDETNKTQPLAEVSSQLVEDNADISIFGTDTDNSDTSETEEPAYFDDIEAVKQDLLSVQHHDEAVDTFNEEKAAEDTKQKAQAHPAAEQDKATELLMQIAHEISDLKAELTSLKAGLAIQSESSSDTAVKTAAPLKEEKAAESESTGFFSDDDADETIALTGDELNNILITADFTEERNAEEDDRTGGNEDYEVPPVLTKDIVHDTDDTIAADADFEASIAEPEEVQAESTHSPEEEGEKLLASDPVFNVDPVPITSLPEDLSYLDDETVTTDDDITLVDEAETEPQSDAAEGMENADNEAAFEDVDIEAFDIPSEQEIEMPQQDELSFAEEAEPISEIDEDRTIHELQKDEDFNNPFAGSAEASDLGIKDEIIEEPFTGNSSVSGDENKTVEEQDDIPELIPEEDEEEGSPAQKTLLQAAERKRGEIVSIPLELKNEIKSVLAYMDQLLEALPEKKIEEFAKSEYFETYKHLFEELGIS